MNQETLKPHSLSMIFESTRIWCEASSLDSPIHTNRPFPHCAPVSKHNNWGRDSSGQFHTAISRKVVSKMCMWQYRKVIWDMINTLFLTLKLSNLLLLLSFNTRKHNVIGVIGRLSVKPRCYWLWRLVISNWCVSIRLLSQLNSRLLLVKLMVSSPVVLEYLDLLDLVNKSFVRLW